MAPNYVEIKNGRLSTPLEHFQQLFEEYLAEHSHKPLVLFFHGSGVKKKKVKQVIENHLSKKAFPIEECFPLYFLWHSGVFEVLTNNWKEFLKLDNTQVAPLYEEEGGLSDKLEQLFGLIDKSRPLGKLLKFIGKRVAKKVKPGDSIYEAYNAQIALIEVVEENIDLYFDHHDERALENIASAFNQIDVDVLAETTTELTEEEAAAIEEELNNDPDLAQFGEESIYEANGFRMFRIIRIIIRIIKRFIKRNGHGFTETILEELLREFLGGPLSFWWNNMRKDVRDSFTPTPDSVPDQAGNVLFDLLEKVWPQLRAPVYLVSSSSGAFYASEILRRLDRQRRAPEIKFKMIYIAPSVSIKEFHDNLGKNSNRIDSVQMFGLNDERERKDYTFLIYRNSIQYFISALLEGDADEPLLGMERYFRNRRPYQLNRAKNRVIKEVYDYLNEQKHQPTWAPTIDLPFRHCLAMRHTQLTEDSALLNCIQYIIKQGQVEEGDFFVEPIAGEGLLEADGLSLAPGITAKAGGIYLDGTSSLLPPHQWDAAYQHLHQNPRLKFVEPKLLTTYHYQSPDPEKQTSIYENFGGDDPDTYDSDWKPTNADRQGLSKIWHLDDDHSQLHSAIAHATQGNSHTIRIAHIDTGYDPNHLTFPDHLIRFDLQRNFVAGEPIDDATDRTPINALNPLLQPRHGKGTLSILAGKAPNQHGHQGAIGLDQNIEIVPIRIGSSVVQWRTESFVNAMDYLIRLNATDDDSTRIHVVTMSMGGVASEAWAKVINKAYEEGLFIVTAAGNNFNGFPTRTLVFPARFHRVVAACGVTYDFDRYYKSVWQAPGEMQGNYGPRRFMKHAVAAFTPNMPWAKADDDEIVQLSGAGTSSATPQIAMAAALYYLYHHDDLEKLDRWQRVEAIRYALYKHTLKNADLKARGINRFTDEEFELYFGNGVLQARTMLDEPVDATNFPQKASLDFAIYPIWNLLGGSIYEADNSFSEMFQLEIQQLVMMDPELQQLSDHEEIAYVEMTAEKQQQFLHRLLQMPQTSQHLRSQIRALIKTTNQA